jgi:hypothetical protein
LLALSGRSPGGGPFWGGLRAKTGGEKPIEVLSKQKVICLFLLMRVNAITHASCCCLSGLRSPTHLHNGFAINVVLSG